MALDLPPQDKNDVPPIPYVKRDKPVEMPSFIENALGDLKTFQKREEQLRTLSPEEAQEKAYLDSLLQFVERLHQRVTEENQLEKIDKKCTEAKEIVQQEIQLWMKHTNGSVPYPNDHTWIDAYSFQSVLNDSSWEIRDDSAKQFEIFKELEPQIPMLQRNLTHLEQTITTDRDALHNHRLEIFKTPLPRLREIKKKLEKMKTELPTTNLIGHSFLSGEINSVKETIDQRERVEIP